MGSCFQLFSTIRGKIFLLLLGVFVPILLIKGYDHYHRFRDRQANEFAANLEVATAAAQTTTEYIRHILHLESAIGLHLTFPHLHNGPEMNEILTKSKTEFPEVRNFSWVSPDGRVVASSMKSTIGIDLGDRAYLRETLAGKEWAVSDLLHSRTTGEPIFAISRGIRDSHGHLLGIVLAAIYPEKLGERLSVRRINDGSITLFDNKGNRVFQNPPDTWEWNYPEIITKYPAVRNAFGGKETIVRIKSIDGKEWMTALVPLAMSGWVVCASRSVDQALQPIISRTLQQGGFYLLLVATVFAAAMLFSRRIVAPLKKLHEHAIDLARGDSIQKIEIAGSGELRDLSLAFNTMAEEVGKREEALRATRRQIASLMEAIPAFVYLQAPDYSIQYCNRTFREIFGDPEGKPCHKVLRGEEKPCAECTINNPLQLRISQVWEWESPNGRIYRVYDRPFNGLDGFPVVLKMGIDVTSQKETEQALLKEKEFVESIINTVQSIILLLDPEGRIAHFNPYMEILSGYRIEEVRGKDWFNTFLPEQDRTAIQEVFARSISDIPTGGNINPILIRNGEECFIEWHYNTLRDTEKRIIGVICVGYDITERMKTQEMLRASEEKYRTFFENSPLGIIHTDRKGIITACNEKALEIMGRPSDEIVGFDTLCDMKDEKMRALIAAGLNGLPSHFEGNYHHTSRELITPLKVDIRPIPAEDGIVSGVIAIFEDIAERKKAEKALAESEAQLRRLSARLFAAQEEERKRIAGELHDSIGQTLAAMKFSVEHAIQNSDRTNPDEAFEALEFLVPFIQNAIQEARTICTGLRPPILDKLGILATINWFCRDFEKVYPMLRLEIALDIEEQEIPEELKIIIFRMTQEAMNNMAKYSRAERVHLFLSKNEGMIRLDITDNGDGFDPHGMQSKGLGLTSMRERVELSGGRFTIASGNGLGTAIRAEWPIAAKRTLSPGVPFTFQN